MQFAWQSNGYLQSYTTIYDYNGSLTDYFFISHLAFSFQFSSSTKKANIRNLISNSLGPLFSSSIISDYSLFQNLYFQTYIIYQKIMYKRNHVLFWKLYLQNHVLFWKLFVRNHVLFWKTVSKNHRLILKNWTYEPPFYLQTISLFASWSLLLRRCLLLAICTREY